MQTSRCDGRANSFWLELRILRNDLTHECEDELEKQVILIHRTVEASKEILAIWQHLLDTLKSRAILPSN